MLYLLSQQTSVNCHIYKQGSICLSSWMDNNSRKNELKVQDLFKHIWCQYVPVLTHFYLGKWHLHSLKPETWMSLLTPPFHSPLRSHPVLLVLYLKQSLEEIPFIFTAATLIQVTDTSHMEIFEHFLTGFTMQQLKWSFKIRTPSCLSQYRTFSWIPTVFRIKSKLSYLLLLTSLCTLPLAVNHPGLFSTLCACSSLPGKFFLGIFRAGSIHSWELSLNITFLDSLTAILVSMIVSWLFLELITNMSLCYLSAHLF